MTDFKPVESNLIKEVVANRFKCFGCYAFVPAIPCNAITDFSAFIALRLAWCTDTSDQSAVVFNGPAVIIGFFILLNPFAEKFAGSIGCRMRRPAHEFRYLRITRPIVEHILRIINGESAKF